MHKITENNILKILQASIPHRFSDITPFDFEDLIALTYKRLEFVVEQTPYSGDFGADIILTDDQNIRIAVQVKRYDMNNKIGVKDLNQLLGAKSYYNCEQAVILTTSTLSKPAQKLAKRTNTKIILWDDLIELFRTGFWEGNNFFDFYKVANQDSFYRLTYELVGVVDFNSGWFYEKTSLVTIIIKINNTTGKNIAVTVNLPTLIRDNNTSIEAKTFMKYEYRNVRVLNGSSMRIMFGFAKTDVNKICKGEKIMLEISITNQTLCETICDEYYFERDFKPKDYLLDKNNNSNNLFIKNNNSKTEGQNDHDSFFGGCILAIIFGWLLFAVIYSLFN